MRPTLIDILRNEWEMRLAQHQAESAALTTKLTALLEAERAKNAMLRETADVLAVRLATIEQQQVGNTEKL
jgi:hypothetical protein